MTRPGRPPDRSWESPEAAEKRAIELLGPDALDLLRFVYGRLRSSAEMGLTKRGDRLGPVWEAAQEREKLVAKVRKVDESLADALDQTGSVDRKYPYSTRVGRAGFIRVVVRAKHVLGGEVPRDEKERERRARILSAHVPVDQQSATAWAMASIAIGLEERCRDADEFWDRQKDWKKELARLNSRGQVT